MASLTNTQKANYLFPPLSNERPAFLNGHRNNNSNNNSSSNNSSSNNSNSNNNNNNNNIINNNNNNSSGLTAMINAQNHHFQDPHDQQVPLFARHQQEIFREEEEEDRMSREDVHRLRETLEETSRHLAQVEHINVDLEHRLEKQARRHVQKIQTADKKLRKCNSERVEAQSEVERWKKEFEAQVRRTEVGAERLRRVEKELYRMHLRKYDVVNNGSGGEMKSSESNFAPGFPVPQAVNNVNFNYNTLGNEAGNVNDIHVLSKTNQNTQKTRMMDEQRRAMATAKMSNMPCYVHGRVGCPCSAMAYETNVSEGLNSLACFLGLEEGNEDVTTQRRRRRHQPTAATVINSSRRQHIASGEFQTPEMRPQNNYTIGDSPGGLSLPGYA
jgi:hypothetical protein